jgi:hypothetical protein
MEAVVARKHENTSVIIVGTIRKLRRETTDQPIRLVKARLIDKIETSLHTAPLYDFECMLSVWLVEPETDAHLAWSSDDLLSRGLLDWPTALTCG